MGSHWNALNGLFYSVLLIYGGIFWPQFIRYVLRPTLVIWGKIGNSGE